MRFKNPPWDFLGKVISVVSQPRKFFVRELVYSLEAIKGIKEDNVRLIALQDMYKESLSNLNVFRTALWQSVPEIDAKIRETISYDPSRELYIRLKEELHADMDKYTEMTEQVFASINQLKAKIKINEKYIAPGNIKMYIPKLIDPLFRFN